MSIQTRLNDEQAALLSHPIVQSVTVVKHTESRLDGYVRLRSTLINGDFLEIALHVQLQPEYRARRHLQLAERFGERPVEQDR